MASPIRQYQTDDGYLNDVGLGNEFQIQGAYFTSGGVEVRGADSVGEFINVLESVTVAISSGVGINVFDTVGDTDAVVVQIPMQVVAADADAASEAVELAFNPLLVAVSDDVPVAETVALAFVADVVGVASDDVPSTEAVTVQILLVVVVADDTPAAEFVNAAPSLGVSVFDDNTYPPLEPPTMPATGIARDYVDVLEGLGMGLGLPVLAGDDLTVSEAALIGLAIPVRVWDDTPAVDVIDADAVTINPVLIGFDQVVSDTLAPVDVVLVVRVLAVEVSDSVAPVDAVAAALPMLAVAADDTPAVDVAILESQLRLSVFDERPMDDDVAALVSVLLASVSDESHGEDLVLAGIPMAVAVMDVPEEGAVGERRHVSIPRFYEDLHFINDATLEALTSAGALRSGQVQDAELGLSDRVRDARLRTGQGVDEALEG